jgi:hypothetical protein
MKRGRGGLYSSRLAVDAAMRIAFVETRVQGNGCGTKGTASCQVSNMGLPFTMIHSSSSPVAPAVARHCSKFLHSCGLQCRSIRELRPCNYNPAAAARAAVLSIKAITTYCMLYIYTSGFTKLTEYFFSWPFQWLVVLACSK